MNGEHENPDGTEALKFVYWRSDLGTLTTSGAYTSTGDTSSGMPPSRPRPP